MPIFRFMTGASVYRCEAKNAEEALQIAFEALKPGEDTGAVIRSTLRDEAAGERVLRLLPDLPDLGDPDVPDVDDEDDPNR